MDKAVTKQIFIAKGVPTAKSVWIKKGEDTSLEAHGMKAPVVVKACNGGSSVGVVLVKEASEYDSAVEECFKYDNQILVEDFIEGREFSIGVVDGMAYPIVEIIPNEGWYDYENKYKEGATTHVCPAKLDEELTKKIEDETNEVKKKKLEETLINYKELLNNSHIISGYLCDDKVISQCLDGKKNVKDIVLINTGIDTFGYYEEYGSKLEAVYTFIPKDEDFKDEVFGETVILEDVYVKAKRNVDYIESPDELFSRNHLVYRKRGYVGFSDYSIVGDAYEESGFAPLAVAIHILYFGQKSELRVHHFVSESNENISDPARKFAEAMQNLLSWENFDIIPKTKGLQNLLDYYSNGKFPGLGVIKKCSIMHHLELIGKYLEVDE